MKVFKQTEANEFLAVQVKVFDYDEELFPWITIEETYIDTNDNKRKVKLDVEYRAQFDEVASTVRDVLVASIMDAEAEAKAAEASARPPDGNGYVIHSLLILLVNISGVVPKQSGQFLVTQP